MCQAFLQTLGQNDKQQSPYPPYGVYNLEEKMKRNQIMTHIIYTMILYFIKSKYPSIVRCVIFTKKANNNKG